MAKATLNGVVIAESDNFEIVEGNVYFPREALKMEYFSETDLHTTCPWKGQASYYTVNIGEQSVNNAAWVYPEPKKAAQHIKDHVAFYTYKVQVER